MVSLNFRKKIFKISKAIYTTEDKIKKITSFFKDSVRKNEDFSYMYFSGIFLAIFTITSTAFCIDSTGIYSYLP